MRRILTVAMFLLVFLCSCEKEKQEYEAFQIFRSEDSFGNCGWLLRSKDKLYYAPTNLPLEYQNYSGIPEENVIFMQYSLLSDSLHCFDSIFVRVDKSYRQLEITKIL